jgi:hypothetical protein
MKPVGKKHWPTVQQVAAILDSTSAEMCRLLSIGRLKGSKQKDPERAGKAQWLVDPASIAREEKIRKARRVEIERKRKIAEKRSANSNERSATSG